MFQLQSVPLRKHEGGSKIPCIVKPAGDPSSLSKLPTELTSSEALLLHSIVSHRRITCCCATENGDHHEGQRQFSMPVKYNGLVELLSENGDAVPPLRLISEIANTVCQKFLIRSKINVLAEITDKTSVQSLERGTVLTVKGTARVTSKRGTDIYLHCTDKHGFYLYLNYHTVGIFSPLAGPNNIAGVHTIESLVKGFRLPCTVRVVSGKIPSQACDSNRPGVFRLIELRKERIAMISPISSKQILLPLSLKADISFYKPANMKELSRHFIFRQIYDSCSNKVEQYLTAMQVMINSQTSKPTVVTKKEEQSHLFEDVDELYPYIRRGGIPPSMMRAQSLDEGTLLKNCLTTTTPYNRSTSAPITNRERSGSLGITQVLKQHTISTSTTETTFQFRSTSDSLTLGKTDALKQFIQKHASKDSLSSRSSQENDSSSVDDIYHTLDNRHQPVASQVKDLLICQGVCLDEVNRG